MTKSVILKVNLGFHKESLPKSLLSHLKFRFEESFEEKETFVKEFYSTTGFVQISLQKN